MSHVIAPEVTIDSTPLLMEFCSDDFDINTVKLSLNEVEAAAKAVKEACSVSAKAINNAKSHVVMDMLGWLPIDRSLPILETVAQR